MALSLHNRSSSAYGSFAIDDDRNQNFFSWLLNSSSSSSSVPSPSSTPSTTPTPSSPARSQRNYSPVSPTTMTRRSKNRNSNNNQHTPTSNRLSSFFSEIFPDHPSPQPPTAASSSSSSLLLLSSPSPPTPHSTPNTNHHTYFPNANTTDTAIGAPKALVTKPLIDIPISEQESLVDDFMNLFTFEFEVIITRPLLQNMYLDYLVSHNKEEALLFLINVNHFKTLDSDEERFKLANRMIQLFIYDNGRHQVNLDNKSKIALLHHKISLDNTPVTYFDQVALKLKIQLLEESFVSFVRCSAFKAFVKQELLDQYYRTGRCIPLPESLQSICAVRCKEDLYMQRCDIGRRVKMTDHQGIIEYDYRLLKMWCDNEVSSHLWKRWKHVEGSFTILERKRSHSWVHSTGGSRAARCRSSCSIEDRVIPMIKVEILVPADMSTLFCLMFNRRSLMMSAAAAAASSSSSSAPSSMPMSMTVDTSGSIMPDNRQFLINRKVTSIACRRRYRLGRFFKDRFASVYYSARYENDAIYVPYKSFEDSDEPFLRRSSNGAVRASCHGGYILRCIQPNLTLVTQVAHVDYGGWVPDFVTRRLARERAQRLCSVLQSLSQADTVSRTVHDLRSMNLLKLMT